MMTALCFEGVCLDLVRSKPGGVVASCAQLASTFSAGDDEDRDYVAEAADAGMGRRGEEQGGEGVRAHGNRRRVLDNATGRFPPGVTGVIGPSGKR